MTFRSAMGLIVISSVIAYASTNYNTKEQEAFRQEESTNVYSQDIPIETYDSFDPLIINVRLKQVDIDDVDSEHQ